MAQTFFPITPTEITPSAANDWVTMNASALAPANATGVILHIVNNQTTVRAVGIRKNGSTDDRHSDITYSYHFWCAIGVDASRYFEAYVGSTTSIDIYVVGYTMAGVTFKTNADDMSLGTTGSWQDIDCSSEAPSAIGLIWEIVGSEEIYREFGLKKNGSSDDRHKDTLKHSCLGAVIGCDASQICEGYIEATTVDFFLVGYITDGAIFNTNADDVSLGSAGFWLDLSALPATANIGFIEVCATAAYIYGLRKNGSAEDIFLHIGRHPWGIVECDEDRFIEGKISNTETDFFVVGYSTVVTETPINVSDTGSGVDATPSIAVSLSLAETGQGVDAVPALSPTIPAIPDTGLGTDLIAAIEAALTLAETGSGVDAVNVNYYVTFVNVSDVGEGADVITLAITIPPIEDFGVGVDQILGEYTKVVADQMYSSEWLGVAASMILSELAEGADNVAVQVTPIIEETGQGLDSVVINTSLNVAEVGSGQEVITITATIPIAETGAGVDTALAAVSITIADTGQGVDAILKRVLQLVKMLVLTRNKARMRVQTTNKARITIQLRGGGQE